MDLERLVDSMVAEGICKRILRAECDGIVQFQISRNNYKIMDFNWLLEHSE